MNKLAFLILPAYALSLIACNSGGDDCHCCYDEDDPASIPTHNHMWCDPEWSWSEDNKVAVATFKCSVYTHYHKEEAKLDDDQIEINTLKEADHYKDGIDEYIASVTFNNSIYISPSHHVIVPKEAHEFNDFGVCETDGEFLYLNNKVQADGDWHYEHGEYRAVVEIGSQLKNIGDTVFYAYKMECSGHKIRLENLVDLTEDEFSFGVLRYEDWFSSVDLEDFDSLEVGLGECLFIKIQAKTIKTNPSFTIYEDHNLNYINLCPHCGKYYGGYLVHNQQGITFDFTAGVKYTFRWQAFPGQRFYVFYQNSLAGHESEFEFFTVDSSYAPVSYNPADPFPADPFPDDGWGHILYVYGVFTPLSSGENGYIAVDLEPES